MMNETPMAVDYDVLYDAVEHALANFLCTDDIDKTMIELVADRITEHWDRRDSDFFEDVLASTSTYVCADLDEVELNDYVGEMITQLEDYEVL
jgi:hypothetical protein